MWNFVVVINGSHIDVFEGPGKELLGCSKQRWANAFGSDAFGQDIMLRVEDPTNGLKNGLSLLLYSFATGVSTRERSLHYVVVRSRWMST